MTVAAVIPHWNHRDLLATLLENLRTQTRPFDQIIVADNGSTDDSVQLAERTGAQVIRLGGNLGFAAAVNRGVQAAQTGWIAILNNDVILEPEWLATLVDAAEDGSASFATGKILRSKELSILDGTFDEVSRGACAWRCGAGRPDSPTWDQARRIRIAPMTAALFRRALFEEIGPLDEMLESYLEDVDFGLRCALAGHDGIYVPTAVAYHRGSSTLGAWTSDTVRYISRNQTLLAAKHFHGQPVWPLLVGQLLWGILSIRHGRGFAYFRGKFAGLRAARRLQVKDASEIHRHPAFEAIINASEKEIFNLQQKTGFDWYWRAYFWLLRP